MQLETREMRKLSNRVIILIIGCVVLFVLSVVKNIINEKWARERNNVACIPVDTEITYPGVYLQSAAHPVNSEARLQSFMEHYVHLTKNDYQNIRDTIKLDCLIQNGSLFFCLWVVSGK